MTLGDYEPTSEPEPVIQLLRRFIQAGEQFLSKPLVNVNHLRIWTQDVRRRLSKLYGKDAVQLSCFPQLEAAFPDAEAREELGKRVGHLKRIVAALENLPEFTQTAAFGKRVFIGHGRSQVWRVLKDFLADQLGLPWDEFNREATAGYPTTDRLHAMMSQAVFAFLIMTAEEDHADATVHARPNVIHEVGLFQGHLGFTRAIVMLEEGCSEFSNIVGLSQIRFPRGDIAARFEEVRRVLKREGLI
jgi:predicted nucleotide-binding protein